MLLHGVSFARTFVVDLSGEHYVDLEHEAMAAMKKD
jgi:hypothetical protein